MYGYGKKDRQASDSLIRNFDFWKKMAKMSEVEDCKETHQE